MKILNFFKNFLNRVKKIEESEKIPSIKNIFENANKHKLEILGISHTSDSNIYVAILGEENGDRKVPVVITYNEAQSVAIEIERIKPVVPIIYDVLKNIIINNGLKYNEIVISDLKNDTLVTYLVGDDNIIEIRTADALSVSIRMEYPIYILDEALEKVDELVQKYYDIKKADQQESFSAKDFNSLDLNDLKDLLDKAISNEEYEKASEIRDEINKKKKKN